MYKCKECGTEYETKPDYCDCGNDTFEIFVVPEKPAPVPTSAPTPLPTVPPTKQPVYNEDFERLKKFFDPISTIIFLLCVISGLAVIFFVANPTKQTVKTPEKTEVQIQNIPSVESFWDNTLAKTQTPQPIEEPIQVPQPPNIIQKIIQPAVQKPATTVKPVKTITKTQTKPTVQKKETSVQTKTQPTTTTKSAPKTDPNIAALTQRVQTNANNSVTKSQSKTQTKTQTTVPKTQTQTTVPVLRTTNTQTQTLQTQVIAQPQAVTQPVVDTAKLKQELSSYKISLRNTIGKKINFNNVVGDGNCTVSFKISSSGQLTNRAFSQQSSNLTLNDAVYAAVASTASFSAPPAGYKNETLSLKVSFYNGNFDITLY